MSQTVAWTWIYHCIQYIRKNAVILGIISMLLCVFAMRPPSTWWCEWYLHCMTDITTFSKTPVWERCDVVVHSLLLCRNGEVHTCYYHIIGLFCLGQKGDLGCCYKEASSLQDRPPPHQCSHFTWLAFNTKVGISHVCSRFHAYGR